MDQSKQTGSTLIIVLFMLIAVTIIGTIAVRSSLTSLSISTNSQAQALLTQSSDSVFFNLETLVDDPEDFMKMRVGDGMLAYVLRPENKSKELVFCMRAGNSAQFVGSRIASVVYWPGKGKAIRNSDLGKVGFCQVSRGADFLSGRKATLTQVTVRASQNNEDWEHMLEGDDAESSKSKGVQRVTITATSLLPSLSESSVTAINACLTNFTSFVDEVAENKTVTDCLSEANVPYSTQEMEYTLKAVK